MTIEEMRKRETVDWNTTAEICERLEEVGAILKRLLDETRNLHARVQREREELQPFTPRGGERKNRR